MNKSAGVQLTPFRSRRDWLWGLMLILSVILTYTPVWKAGFVWDDGKLDEAILENQKALEIKPNYAEAHTSLGMALSQKGQVDEAVEQFQKALEIEPKDAVARNSLGIALAKKGQMYEAIEQFEEAFA